MTRKNDLAARAASIAGRGPARGAEAAPAAPSAAVRSKPVKLSTEVSPNRHRFLTNFVQGVAAEVGRARVAHSEVMRALLAELENDPALQARISAVLVEQLRD